MTIPFAMLHSPSTTRVPAGIGVGRRVLVVMEGNRGPHLKALREKGFDVEQVAHGNETLASLIRQPPDAMIIEWLGRNEKPVALLMTVRQYLGLTTLAVILLRAGAPITSVDAVRSYGIARELSLPPTSPMEVVASVAEALSIPLYPSRPKPKLSISKNLAARVPTAQVIGTPGVTTPLIG